jgi:hypothetical protein
VAEDRLAAHHLLHLGNVQANLPADARGPGVQRCAPRAQLRFECESHPRPGVGRAAVVTNAGSFRFRAVKAAVPSTNPTSQWISSDPAVVGPAARKTAT